MVDSDMCNRMLGFIIGYHERNGKIPRLIANPITLYCSGDPDVAVAVYGYLEQHHPAILKNLIDLEDEVSEEDAIDSDVSANHPGAIHPEPHEVVQTVVPADVLMFN